MLKAVTKDKEAIEIYGLSSLGKTQQGTFFVPLEDYKLLRECFSRDIYSTHEKRWTIKKLGCPSFWLAADLCRQPHHPPKIALKLPKGEPTTDVVCIHIVGGVSSSGCSMMSILAYPTTGCARHRLACGSFEIHKTRGASGYTLSCPDAVLHLMADTGGSGHQQPFHLLIGYGKETVTITTSYCSYRGAVNTDEELSVSLSEMGFIFKKGYSAKIIRKNH